MLTLADPRHLQTFQEMGSQICCPQLPSLVACFIYEEQHPDADPLDQYPPIITQGYSYSSAIATFDAPNELCGITGMHRQRIHASPS
jgi:hypothetical protein